jgi:hypothetical protein
VWQPSAAASGAHHLAMAEPAGFVNQTSQAALLKLCWFDKGQHDSTHYAGNPPNRSLSPPCDRS